MRTSLLSFCVVAAIGLHHHVVVSFAPAIVPRWSPLVATTRIAKIAIAPSPTPSSMATTALSQSVAASITEMDPEELLEYLNSDAIGLTFEQYHRRERHKRYLENCLVFDNVARADLDRLADSMREVKVSKDTVLIEMGDRGDAMYFVVDGAFEVFGDNSTLIGKYQKPGEYFGELALIFKDQARKATIVASEDSLVYKLDKTAFRTSMQDSPVFDTARRMLLKKYSSTRLLQVLPKIQFREVWDLAMAKLQVKSASTNLVPAMFSFGMGASCTILASLLSGRVVPSPSPKWPALFDTLATAPSLVAALPIGMASFMLMITAVLGQLSIPKDKRQAAAAAATPNATSTSTTSRKDRVPRRRHQLGSVMMALLWLLVATTAQTSAVRLAALQLQTMLSFLLETTRRAAMMNGGKTQPKHNKGMVAAAVASCFILGYEALRILVSGGSKI